MKSEQIVKDELQKLKEKSVPNLLSQLADAVDDGRYDDATEDCFSLMVNLAALIAAERVLE